MRLLCVGDSSKNTDGRPCGTLSEAVTIGGIFLRISGKEGLITALHDYPIDIIVIQQTRPDPVIIRFIRTHRINTPLLIIARELTAEHSAGVLSVGADDCVPITMAPVELLARLRAIVRRTIHHTSSSQTMVVGRLMINEDTREVLIDSDVVHLTKGEYDIMALIVRRRGSLLNKQAIFGVLYAGRDKPISKTVDVMICRIRKKLRPYQIEQPFKTSWNMGYCLNEDAFLPLGAREQDLYATAPHKETSMPITTDGGVTAVPH